MSAGNKRFLGYLILLYLLLVFLIPRNGHYFDLYFFSEWTKSIVANGIGRAYEIPGMNYTPLYLYILKLYGLLQKTTEAVWHNIHYIRLFTLVFDMGAIYLAAVFLSKRNISREATFFILFNIAYLYNTMVWGQADSIHTTLVFASFIFCFRGNAVLSWILFLLAVNMKLQAIVFFPHLLFLSALFVKNKRDVLAGFGLAALTQIAILLPFILEGTLNEVLKNTSELIGYFPVTSQGAFNIWHLLLDKDPITVPDHNVFLGMTYRTWGLLLFFLFSAFFLLPVFRVLARSGQQSGIHSIGIFFLSCSLTALFFFYFNTEMHERYVHPAILFAGLHAIIFRSYPYYILLSAAYTLNLEKIMLKYLSVNHNTLIFDRQFIALVFALAMLTGMYEIIRQLRAFRNTHTAISASAQEQNNYPQTYSA